MDEVLDECESGEGLGEEQQPVPDLHRLLNRTLILIPDESFGVKKKYCELEQHLKIKFPFVLSSLIFYLSGFEYILIIFFSMPIYRKK